MRVAALTLLAACGSAPSTPDASPFDAEIPADAAGPLHLLGTAYTPVGFPTETAPAKQAFYDTHAAYGRAIAQHLAWRTSEATAGQIHPTAITFEADADAEGFVPMVGFGCDLGGTPDLTSTSEPGNNTWTNAETRTELCAMAADFADAYHPALLFLGNEINSTYYLTHAADWPNWVTELAACRDAVHAVSPDTLVFTVFQYEFLINDAAKTGFDQPPQWQAVADVEDAVDGVGFTTYPYFGHETPAELPDDYYAQITAHTSLPILFTEIGWTANPAVPYTGSEVEQADFVDRFFALTADLDVRYAAYLARNDFDPAVIGPTSAFYEIGLRDADGAARPADARWRAAVTSSRASRTSR